MNAAFLHEVVRWAAPAADLLAGSIWKGLLLVAGVALVLRCVPRLSAAARSAIWTAVLLAVIAMMWLPASPSPVAAAAASGHPVVHASAAWSLLVAGIWLALSLLRLAQLAASALRLRAIVGRAVPIDTEGRLTGLLDQGARRVQRRVQICVSPDVSRPSVAGFFRPRILLPEGLLEDLSEPELQHVLLHEREHLRRGDDWTNLLQELSLALFPLHPALLWLDRRLCVERELACDDGVLRVTRARKAYAACLARLAEDSMMRRGLSLALGLLGVQTRRGELSGRVHRILRSPAAAPSRRQVAAVSAVVLAGVVVGSVALARSPQWISFAAFPDASQTSQTPAQAAAHSVPSVGEGVRQSLRKTQSSKATFVKAFMPSSGGEAQPRLMSRTAPLRGKKLSRIAAPAAGVVPAVRRAAYDMPQQPAALPYFVFTEWHNSGASARLTFAVARYGGPSGDQSAADASQRVLPTYAAVAVQGGWLLIQL